ncbi:hypothetical protein JXA85_03015 [Candidatus Woesearchaeota archaeon]|nr:hypothetical protein [Candidatus Woesearchaeota archaeon]
MTQKDILLRNFTEYFELAEYAFKAGKFNGAVTLYYKALVELCDISLLENTGKIGVNHTERFSLLKEYEPALYETASKLFGFYRDSYSTTISKAIAEDIKKRVIDARKEVIKE